MLSGGKTMSSDTQQVAGGTNRLQNNRHFKPMTESDTHVRKQKQENVSATNKKSQHTLGVDTM